MHKQYEESIGKVECIICRNTTPTIIVHHDEQVIPNHFIDKIVLVIRKENDATRHLLAHRGFQHAITG